MPTLLNASDSHQKTLNKVFEIMKKNNTSQEEQIETTYDAEMSDNIVDWLSKVVVLLDTMHLDLGKLLLHAEAHTQNPIQNLNLHEIPNVKVIELVKLLKDTKIIEDFDSNSVILSKLDKIDELLESLKNLVRAIFNTIHRITIALNGLPNSVVNTKYRQTYALTFKHLVDNVLQPLLDQRTIIRAKMNDRSTRQLTGGSMYDDSIDMKYQPMYQTQKYVL